MIPRLQHLGKDRLLDAAKAVLRGKFIAINAYIKKKDLKEPSFTSQGTNKKRTEPKVTRRNEIIKIRAEIETRKTIEKKS